MGDPEGFLHVMFSRRQSRPRRWRRIWPPRSPVDSARAALGQVGRPPPPLPPSASPRAADRPPRPAPVRACGHARRHRRLAAGVGDEQDHARPTARALCASISPRRSLPETPLQPCAWTAARRPVSRLAPPPPLPPPIAQVALQLRDLIGQRLGAPRTARATRSATSATAASAARPPRPAPPPARRR